MAQIPAHPRAVFLAEHGGRCLFEHLLVTALERAIALTQVDRIAFAVAEHLEFDVARVAQVFFEIDGRVPERRLRLAPGLLHQRLELVLGRAHLHPASATAGCGLDDDRIARRRRDLLRFGEVADRPGRSRHQRQAERTSGTLGFDLVAHRADVLGLRPDEDDVVRLDDLGELRILAEEAVARVDRVRARDLGGRDDVGDVEIALGRGRRTDADRLVREPDVHGVGIRGRMDRDRLDPHLMTRAVDAERDLAAVGDQQLLDFGHDYSTTTRG